MRLRAPAKINLDLRVTRRRPDGYHDISTIFQSLALHDVVTLEAHDGPLEVTADDPGVPGGRANLCAKAVDALWQALGRPGEPAGWHVTLEKTVRELQGPPCVELDDAPGPKQQIACTRSFGQPIHDLAPLIEAVSEFAARAAEKLRKQNSLAKVLLVFMHTSPHRPGPQCSRSVVVPLRRPTDDTLALTKAAADGMRFMYVSGYRFIKAGVILVELQPASVVQCELDLDPADETDPKRDRSRLMAAMDAINGRFGKGTVQSGATGQTGPTRSWGMRQERRTPQYTTCLEDVPVARA